MVLWTLLGFSLSSTRLRRGKRLLCSEYALPSRLMNSCSGEWKALQSSAAPPRCFCARAAAFRNAASPCGRLANQTKSKSKNSSIREIVFLSLSNDKHLPTVFSTLLNRSCSRTGRLDFAPIYQSTASARSFPSLMAVSSSKLFCLRKRRFPNPPRLSQRTENLFHHGNIGEIE
jgi:hypothetical protein